MGISFNTLDDLADEVASWRLQSELAQVADRLNAFQAIDGVVVFLTRYRAVARS